MPRIVRQAKVFIWRKVVPPSQVVSAPRRVCSPHVKGGHSKNRVFFSITDKKFTLSWVTHRCFNFWSGYAPNEKEAKSSTPGAAILKGSWRPGHISVTSFRPRMCLFLWASSLVWLRLKLERASDSGDVNNQVEWNDWLENALWCTCQRCATMPTQRECVCCREQLEWVTKREGTFCSTITMDAVSGRGSLFLIAYCAQNWIGGLNKSPV